MTTASEEKAIVAIRTAWLATCASQCQLFSGQAGLLLDVDELRPIVPHFLTSLPPSSNQAEELLLQRLLVGLCARLGRLLHDRAHASQHSACAFVPCRLLDLFWQQPNLPTKLIFAQWTDAFTSAFAQAHPPSPSEKAAAEIRHHYAKAWRLSELAAVAGVTTSQVNRAFAREYGMTAFEYLRRMRLLTALEHMASNRARVEPLARQVGYQSKKNFYRAFRSVTKLTPSQFNHLPSHRKRDITTSLRFSLIRHIGPRTPAGTHAA